MFMWVTVELFFWGFLTFWLEDIAKESIGASIVLVLLSALIFWDLFVRVQQSFSIGFLEDIWARNVINVFTAPITKSELILGFVAVSVIQGLLSFVYVGILAFLLYALEIWQVGIYIIPFFVNIFVFGWALGLVATGLILRFGPSVEILAWFIPFVMLPFSAVYHPASAFPEFVYQIAQFFPTMHLFEGMRIILGGGLFPLEHLVWASVLNIVYFVLGLAFFAWMIHVARKKGLIARLLA